MTCPAHDLARSRAFLTVEDVDLIRELVARLDDLPLLLVVDLGAGSGTTAAAVFAERPDAVHVTSIDINEENLRWARLFIDRIGHGHHWTGAVSDSVGLAAGWPTEVDLLLIDTSHEYEATVAELAVWLPKLSADGLVWCHDYVGDYPGVKRAVDEAVAAGKVKTIEVRGLSWAGRKLV